MLIQSHLGKPSDRIVELLPALPDSWSKGKISGIKARGNFTFELEWENGKLKTATVYAEKDNTLKLKLNNRTGEPKEKNFTIENSILKAEMKAGEKLELMF